MGIEENKEVVRCFFSEFANKRNFSAADELVSENFVMHTPGRNLIGVEAVKQAYSASSNSFPDILYTVENIVAEGDKVAFRVTIQGTHTQPFRNLAPTNRTFEISRFVIMHLDNGKFSEGWVLDDNLGRYQQLGALPPTEEILGSERRITMYARLTLGQVQQGKMDEAIQKYNDINIAEIKSHQGFQKAYLLVNREESKVIALSFWDSEEDALAREATDEYRQAHAYLPDLAAAPPVREGYEIAVES